MAVVPHAEVPRLLAAAFAPVDAASMVLVRLGEACNLRCPMCTNSGVEAQRKVSAAELERRLRRLEGLGFRGVALTGGEPTIHPAFAWVTQWLGERRWRWFLHTNATHIAGDCAQQWKRSGLERALVSLHGPREAHVAMSGVDRFEDTVRGIDHLHAAGVEVVLNLVLARSNLPVLAEHVGWVAERFPGVGLKLVWGARVGKGAADAQVHLSLDQIREPLRAAVRTAKERGVGLALEGLPRCVLGAGDWDNIGRFAWGETHYLDDAQGDRIVSMAWLDAVARHFPPACTGCRLRRGCGGLPLALPNDPGLGPRWGLGRGHRSG
jgi:hypothetical protein